MSKPSHSSAQGTDLPALKRGRGRPRKNPLSALDPSELDDSPGSFTDKKTGMKVKDGRELVVFRKMLADAEKSEMTPAAFDGGGTLEAAPTVTKDSLLRRVTRRLNVLDRFLTDDKLVELLAFSSLKEIGIYEGIMLDKSMVLQGQPTVIIGNDERRELKDTLPRLMEELKRRGLINQSAQPKMVN
jgi:hypothetical protein